MIMTEVVDRLKEAAEFAAECRVPNVTIDIVVRIEGVDVVVRRFHGDKVAKGEQSTTWLVIETAHINPITRSIDRLLQEVLAI